MGKSIVLFSDGTGNSSAKAQKTNVWRLFQAVTQTDSSQIAKYDDGVGSSSNKYFAALGGAFGIGLKRNVIDLYKFVCRNYVPGDEIYGFGFSRGAFTIRVLIGLISREGLVPYRSEQELDRHAAAAYRSFRYKAFPSSSPIVWLARKLRDLVLKIRDLITGLTAYAEVAAQTRESGRSGIPIRFLGLWDTVEAYGMPIVELKRAINWALWPMLFGDMKLSTSVQRAVHALSLDDERTTFHPLLWDEVWERELAASREVKPERITQVWFAGVHSNVGGGYPEDRLSLVPLGWIIDEATKSGLIVNSEQRKQFAASQSPFARMYNSRGGFAAYYRYSPRQTPVLWFRQRRILANVHWTVLVRMALGSDAYASIALPHEFNVLLPSGTFVEFSGLVQSLKTGGTSGDATLDSAIGQLQTPIREDIGLVWDTVFWRKCLYVATALLTTLALIFPWLTKLLPSELSVAESVVGGPVSTVVQAFSAVIPSYAGPWKRALSDYPLEFGLLLIGIALTMLGSQALNERIHTRARIAWHRFSQPKIQSFHHWRAQTRNAFGRSILFWVVVLTLVALSSYFWQIIHREAPTLWRGFFVSALLLALAYVASIIGYRETPRTESTRLRNTWALRLARVIRDNWLLSWGYAKWNQLVAPSIFVVLLVAAGATLLNRAAFDVMDSAGVWCQNGMKPNGPGGAGWQENLKANTSDTFSTNKICWPTGLVLIKGHRYVVAIAMPRPTASEGSPEEGTSTQRWFDRDVPTDVFGFDSGGGFVHQLGTPLKRWWTESWFKPIARIGRFGNDEYSLDPLDAVAPLEPTHCSRDLHMPRGFFDSRTSKISAALAAKLNGCAPVPDDRRTLRSEITARRDGELFIYVNDAVLGIPGLKDLFYRNNSGEATVTVTRPKSVDP